MTQLTLHEFEYMVFDIYFAGLVSMSLHPGAGLKKDGYDNAAPVWTVAACADKAMEMIAIRRSLLGYK